ncbi:MAG: hypothetical protein UT48_C0010G0078 [Parcubacteria group bacterium GW2011_GWE2_39_37]|uniref:Sphingomyelin synthase-like domain-containing protein n=1 Tax=Candidatus Falkowbacteria bacterium GW2011_GWF2_39_8 TaxID=1618642 RepID=A0A0G0PU80_9BACT|nr:MAG: hypothetical protein UT48_C0010G0078 [Parcubacteria group bacterium GW2011_GWE2_39_37]KKR31483.1 MAG: hypothetical protein UT64_C0059G0006 [Candidatus Falkowbacteria bacterium GW2011_GWF2_39_8]
MKKFMIKLPNNKFNKKSINKKYIFSTLTGVVLLLASLFFNFFASSYATRQASNSVDDILLDKLPVFDVNFIFVNGAVIFVLLIFILMITNISQIPFILKMTALFIFIRSISVTLTHLAPPPDMITINTDMFQKFVFGADLFFSGHVGFPFIFSLAYQHNKYLRNLFIIASLIGATSVILGHLHYSIDVFGAYFISFTIFSLAKNIFKADYDLFLGKEAVSMSLSFESIKKVSGNMDGL